MVHEKAGNERREDSSGRQHPQAAQPIVFPMASLRPPQE